MVGICPGGICPVGIWQGGNCPVGICPVGICPGVFVLESLDHVSPAVRSFVTRLRTVFGCLHVF